MTTDTPAPPPVRRSTLIVPVHVPKYVERAAARGADSIMLDLEDSVAPNAKEEARAAVRAAIGVVSAFGARISVRVNHSTWEEDVRAAVWPGLSGIAFPKAESAAEVLEVMAFVRTLEAERGLPPGSVVVSPALETLDGFRRAGEIGQVSPTGIGGPAPGDFSAQLGIELAPSMDQLEPARGELDLLNRALGGRGSARWRSGETITEYGEAQRDRREVASASLRLDGVRGAAGIHPSVIPPFHAGFTPPDDEVAECEALADALDEARAAGRGHAVYRNRRIPVRHLEAVREHLAFAAACRAEDERRAALQQAATAE